MPTQVRIVPELVVLGLGQSDGLNRFENILNNPNKSVIKEYKTTDQLGNLSLVLITEEHLAPEAADRMDPDLGKRVE